MEGGKEASALESCEASFSLGAHPLKISDDWAPSSATDQGGLVVSTREGTPAATYVLITWPFA
jgi:hypothetical protein